MALVLVQEILSQSEYTGAGARSAGMGQASSTLSDPYSVVNNVGGLGRLNKFSVYASCEVLFNLLDLSHQSAGCSIPLKLGNLGIDFNRLGGPLFSDFTGGLSYANQFGLASLGIKLDFRQRIIEGLEQTSNLIVEFGGIAEITPQWFFGGHIYNLAQAGKAADRKNIPTVVKAGVSYRPFDGLMVNLDIIKDVGFDPSTRIGLEYQFFKSFQIRTGLNHRPFKASYGLGFRAKQLSMDYSFNHHNKLGGSSQISVSYSRQ